MEITNKDIEEVINYFSIPILPSKPNYWLIRTEGGTFYNTFKKGNYVSIGFDKVNLDDISLKDDGKLKEAVALLYPDTKRPGTIVSQLRKFKYNVKKGDIIIIPDKNSKNLCIGQAISDIYQINSTAKNKEIINENYTYQKRINTNWIAEVPKSNFDLYVYKLLNSHQGIVSCNDYKGFINRMIFPIYCQDGDMHLTFNITKRNNISLDDYSNMFDTLKYAIDLFNKMTNSNVSKGINIKLTANSPGILEILGNPITMSIIILMFFIAGGKITVSWKKEEKNINLESDGLIDKISKFMRQLHKDEFKKLKLFVDKSTSGLELITKDTPTIKENVNVSAEIIENKKEDNQTSLFD